MEIILGPLDGQPTPNKEILSILTSLESIEKEWERKEREEDPWLLYLHGVMLLKQKNEKDAKKLLLRSVRLYPYHWGAWLELGSTLNSLEDVSASP